MGALDLQWWQAAFAVLTLGGLSAAPWIIALLRGGLVPRSSMLAMLTTKDAQITSLTEVKDAQIAGLQAELDRTETRNAENVARAIAERDHERDAVRIERQRSDDSARAVMQLSREYGETMLHLARGDAGTEPTT